MTDQYYQEMPPKGGFGERFRPTKGKPVWFNGKATFALAFGSILYGLYTCSKQMSSDIAILQQKQYEKKLPRNFNLSPADQARLEIQKQIMNLEAETQLLQTALKAQVVADAEYESKRTQGHFDVPQVDPSAIRPDDAFEKLAALVPKQQ